VDVARAMAPMFAFLLGPVLIPIVAALVGTLSDRTRRSKSRRATRAARPAVHGSKDLPPGRALR
jgi:hypothetical protein